MQRTRHLDLGCGPVPRNPYQQDELFGVDIAPTENSSQITIRQANLTLQAIPFPDHYFDSLSAFDFLEHVPRVLPTPDGLSTRFPFIELSYLVELPTSANLHPRQPFLSTLMNSCEWRSW